MYEGQWVTATWAPQDLTAWPPDSGLFPEKSGNPTDTRATVSASTEFGPAHLYLSWK